MAEMKKGVVFDIKRYAVHDGPGIRVTFFLTGCPLDCWWCHNPECRSLDPGNGDGDATPNGNWKKGWEISVEEALGEIEKEILFLDESGGGATFSGGEPLMQPEFLKAVLEACRRKEIHTILDTSGYAPPEILESVAGEVDLFHFDLKLADDEEHQKFTGVSNELILENLKRLTKWGKPIVIRFPVAPGITDGDANVAGVADCIVSAGGIGEVHVLAYHKAAEGKYERLGLKNRMSGVEPQSESEMERVARRFEERGLKVKIGG